ncbi:MAG: condensation domain-containing protein, partial [Planctomycetota bacterium]
MHSGSRTESEGPADLTGAQHLLWTGQQLHPDVPLYNMAFTFEIEGQLDADTFRAAFSTLIEQVEALRSVIRCVEGVPQQSVLDDFPFELDLIDLEAAGDPAAALAEWAQERCERMLDLEARTFDSALVRMGPDRWAWYLNQHHAITDAWSSTVLFARLSEIYGRLESNEDTDLPPLTSYETYRAFEAKTRSE